MIVDLTAIEGSSQSFDFKMSPEEIDVGDANIQLNGEIGVSGEVVRHAAQTDVSGIINGAAVVECTRCLKPIEKDLAIDFKISYVSKGEFAEPSENEITADDLSTDTLDGESIDIKEIVREQILLDLPEQVFCKPDCKGLCPRCGSDRNLISCNCEDEEIDPRWAALKNLK